MTDSQGDRTPFPNPAYDPLQQRAINYYNDLKAASDASQAEAWTLYTQYLQELQEIQEANLAQSKKPYEKLAQDMAAALPAEEQQAVTEALERYIGSLNDYSTRLQAAQQKIGQAYLALARSLGEAQTSADPQGMAQLAYQQFLDIVHNELALDPVIAAAQQAYHDYLEKQREVSDSVLTRVNESWQEYLSELFKAPGQAEAAEASTQADSRYYAQLSEVTSNLENRAREIADAYAASNLDH